MLIKDDTALQSTSKHIRVFVYLIEQIEVRPRTTGSWKRSFWETQSRREQPRTCQADNQILLQRLADNCRSMVAACPLSRRSLRCAADPLLRCCFHLLVSKNVKVPLIKALGPYNVSCRRNIPLLTRASPMIVKATFAEITNLSRATGNQGLSSSSQLSQQPGSHSKPLTASASWWRIKHRQVAHREALLVL